MTTAEFAAILNAKSNGNGSWMAQCPAHEDKTASLSIAEGDEGKTILHCHAGCSFSAIVAAMDLKPDDLFPPKVEKQKPQRKKIVKTYDYTDPDGTLLFQVCRYEPKGFRQRRPDPEKPEAWIWNLKGVTRVLYHLPEIIKTKDDGHTIFCVEGEKDVEALSTIGLHATCNSGGAGKWTDDYTESLTGAKVIILPDRDTPGRKHADLVYNELTDKAESVRIVELPDRNGVTVKDPADWIEAGGTITELQEIAKAAKSAEQQEDNGKPIVLLPAGEQSITDAGQSLGDLLNKTHRFFVRGEAMVRMEHDTEGLPLLCSVKPAALASDFETVAVLSKPDGPQGKTKAVTCPEQTAKLIQASAAFRAELSPIHVLTRCPVLIERDGKLIQICGYDRESGIMAGGDPAEDIPLEEAVPLLFSLVEDFRFATPADRARALAAIITPALVLGGLFKARAPVDLGEADASQSGKGFKVKLKAAVYGESVKIITQQKAGGVGSLEESFNAALIRGACFICLDNIRGKIDSPAFESFLTEDHYTARAAFTENTDIDPRRIIIMMTSNKADVTSDLANRSSCVRILKQLDDYTFQTYPEGDILDHVRANQSRFLGAVFAVVRTWFDAGRPHTAETRHDFRPWAQTLDWITRNILDAGSLLDGHRETQARMTNPVLNWLRDVALEVIHAKQAGAWLRAGDLVDLLAETIIETPGLPEHGDPADPETRKIAQQATGRKLGLCFRAGDLMTMDGMTIKRHETYNPASRYNVREYCFSAASKEIGSLAAKSENDELSDKEIVTFQQSASNKADFASKGASNDAANKTLCASNAANTLLTSNICTTNTNICTTNTKYVPPMETISRIRCRSAAGHSQEVVDFDEEYCPAGYDEKEERIAIQDEDDDVTINFD